MSSVNRSVGLARNNARLLQRLSQEMPAAGMPIRQTETVLPKFTENEETEGHGGWATKLALALGGLMREPLKTERSHVPVTHW